MEWKLNPCFRTGGNIAVGTAAPYTCYLNVHSVKKLPQHTGGRRLWLGSVVDLIDLHTAKDYDTVFYSCIYETTWILFVYIINLCLRSTVCIIRFLVAVWCTGTCGASGGVCTADSPRWTALSKYQKYFAQGTKIGIQVDPAIVQLTSAIRLQQVTGSS